MTELPIKKTNETHDEVLQDLEEKNSNLDIEGYEYDLATNCHIYPLSRQQKGLWFDYKLNPKSNRYNTFSQLNIKSGLNLERFIEAVNIVCNFIPIYRTRFIENEKGEARQIVAPFCFKEDVVEFEDISCDLDLNDEERHVVALKKLNDKQLSPLDLESNDNFKMYLIKYSKESYIFTGIQHHIAIDGVSGLAFIESVILAYNGGLEALKERFGDVFYIDDYLIEYKNLEQQVEEAKKHWGKRLKNSSLFLDMHGRGSEFSMRQNRFSLSKERLELIKKYSRKSKTTPFIVISALYGALLYKYFEQNDILAGYPANIRPKGFKDMFGYYVCQYPIRMQIDGKKPFEEFLQRVTLEQREDRKNLFLTTDQIVDLISKDKAVNRDLNITVGQSLFSDNSLPKMQGVESTTEFGTGLEVKDLSLLFDLQTENFDCRLTYNALLFEEKTIQSFIINLGNFIDEILVEENSEIAIDDINYINKEEKTKLLLDFNDSRGPSKKHVIHELFSKIAKKDPNQTALIFKDKKLSYQELDEKSDKIATYLQSFNVKADDLIGIYSNRSMDMIVGILGILKSGAAYVPFDPTHPKERVEYMLCDSKVKILLSEKDLEDQIDDLQKDGVKTLFLEDIPLEKITKKPKLISKCNNLAYIIYTSGSTGNPKGVMVEHGGFVNMSLDQINRFDIDEKDNVLQFFSQCFDASVYEIFMALLSGASLVIVPSEIRNEKDSFVKYLSDNCVTVATFTPSFLKSLNKDPLSTLETIITAGEAADILDAAYYAKEKKYINAYGPTESSVCSLVYEVKKDDVFKDIVPIGKPISNTKIHILDSKNNLVPIGVYGELHIAGDGLARGYLNREDLTKEKFIKNPFATKEDNEKGINQRLYKTGDLARWLSDGNIEYFGRVDTQVKIRGFRIELGEIENLLNKHSNIKESAVIAKGDEDNKQLIAYYTSNSKEKNKELDNLELKSYLRKSLPEYMIPLTFIKLKEIPLNSNGKIDRKLLSQKDVVIKNNKKYVAPTTKTQKTLAKIFKEVLKLKDDHKVGIEDSFFEMGGNSLLVTQVMYRIKNELSLSIKLADLFENSTILDISNLLSISDSENFKTPTRIEKRPQEIPLSFCQERLWFLDQLEEGARYNVPVALKIKGLLDKKLLLKSLEKIVERHEVFRTKFESSEDKNMPARQVVLDEIKVNYKEIDNCESILDAQKLISQDVLMPFKLGDGNLLRVILFNLAKEGEYVLYVNMHHIISDGWSVGIFLRELTLLYNALYGKKVAKEPDDNVFLPELEIQYADYAIWQREVFSDTVLNKQISYWVDHLDGYSGALSLPTDYSRPVSQSGLGNIISKKIAKKVTQNLRKYSKSQGYTMYMVTLAALYILLKRYSNQNDICIGSPISSRQSEDAEELIGFFINTLAIRINPKEDENSKISVKELMDEVKDISIKGYDNQDAPFERVVERINPIRDLSKSPIFQVLLAYQNTPYGKHHINFENIEAEAIKFDYDISKFDFDISIIDLNEESEGLEIVATYSTDLYKKETIENLLNHYISILESISKDQSQDIDSINYLSDTEKNKLLVDFNDTKANYSKDKTIHELFSKVVKENPNQVAVVFEDQELTYKELDEKSDQLAIYLQSFGVKPDDLIGICTTRSLEMVIGILGIIKSGGAYVALEHYFPEDRLNYMIKNSDINILLTQKSLRGDLEKLSEFSDDIRSINLDLDKDKNWQEKDILSEIFNKSLKKNSNENNLVYVIYTSGSTGNPKGVMVNHQSLCNLIEDMIKRHNFSKKDGLLALATYCFDMFEVEFFLPLISGAKYYICSKEATQDAFLLKEKISQVKPTLMQATPSTWTMLFDAGWKNEEGVKILCGGEALTEKLQNLFIETNTVAYNMYGPTEATVWSSGKVIEESDQNTLSIGKPISNTKIHILDSKNNLVPIGIYGELHISGDGLARGYLNREDLTKEKFIKNPFATKEDNEKGINQRLYKTGDLARWLSDGNIEYFGRIDTQVKIRGFRIELGEIENLLNKHPQLKESAVIAKGDEDNKQLIAYYTSKEKDKDIDNLELKTYLRKSLPEYMIPLTFIKLKEIPLNSNGKIDRKLLSQKDVVIKNNKKYVAPTTKTQKTLAKIFKEVLKLKDDHKVGIEDSFFEMGGHSLLAIQLSKGVKDRFKKEVSLSLLFQYPTIKELELFLNSKEDSSIFNSSNLVLLKAKGEKNPIFYIPGIGGSSAYFIELANSLDAGHSCYGLNYPGYFKDDKTYKTIESLAKNYIPLIKKVQKTGPYNLVGHSFGAIIAFEIAYQMEQKNEKVKMINLDGSLDIIERIHLRYCDKEIKDRNLELIIALLRVLEYSEKIKLDHEALKRSLKPLPKNDRFEFVKNELKKFDVEMSIEYISHLSKVVGLQADMTYNFKDKKIDNITLFKAQISDKDSHDYNAQDWQKHAKNLRIINAKGDHFAMLKNSNAKDLAKKIREVLA